jgi:hypothetical protein
VAALLLTSRETLGSNIDHTNSDFRELPQSFQAKIGFALNSATTASFHTLSHSLLIHHSIIRG